MGIRIQPLDVKVPKCDPFRNDLLGRKKPVEVLTHLIGSIEGPCALAVDAAWGAGKTTFLRIWAQYLRNQKFPIVKFNAWETDFSGDPFVTLSTELREGLQEYTNESIAQKMKDTERWGKEVLRRTIPTLIRFGSASIPLVGTEVGQVLAHYAEERLSEYQKAKESVQEFKHALQNVADAVSKSRANRPLIVMIDELDRCRPLYAVELLEVAKHLFAVNHVVFVLAVNRSELAHSIRALYGSEFDAQGYLRRFFDVDFRLPEPDRKAFINEMLASVKIDEYFNRTKDQMARGYYENVKEWLQIFFHAPDLSLRRIAQAIHRLGLMFASLRSDQRSFMLTAVVCLILRTIDSDLYYRFSRGEVSDLDVVDKVFNRSRAATLEEENGRPLFEAIVIMAAQEEASSHLRLSEPISSPLLRKYGELVDANKSASSSTGPEYNRANRVVDLVKQIRNGIDYGVPIGFKDSVNRIELLSASLIDKPATQHADS